MKWFLMFIWVLQASLLCAQSKPDSFDQQIAKTANGMVCDVPDEEKPVTLNAKLVADLGGDSIAVIVKACLAPGWHLYAYVPENMPYLLTECLFEHDAGVKPIGDWIKSTPKPSTTDNGVLIYEDTAVFIHKLKRTSKSVKGKISTGLYYQTCNLKQCLPPAEAKMELMY